ncbi:MAG: hypothetical protein HYV53_04435 [Parcubacteria group bacterium]|nr:hypothetical protein [Parcubacteria group bacterium]
MIKKTLQKDISDSDKKKILEYINRKLGEYEEIEKIFVEQKNENIFEVLVVTKKISPKIEREIVEIEDRVKNKYNVSVNLFTHTESCFVQ